MLLARASHVHHRALSREKKANIVMNVNEQRIGFGK